MPQQFIGSEGQVFVPTEELEVRNKYFVGQVYDEEGNPLFVKAVKEPENPSVKADLENEVRWNETVGPQIDDENYWNIPAVVSHSPDYSWAVFEYIEGKQPGEDTLDGWLPGAITGIGLGLSHMPLGREGSDLTSWFLQRLEKFRAVTRSGFFGVAVRGTIENFQAHAEQLKKIQAGIIHGDINLKNLIVSADKDPKLFLTDAEFGTLPAKPEWDKPRLHDMAYFYHLLRCQYQRPDLAESFLKSLGLNAEAYNVTLADFVTEFHLSVLERTISMMGHFIIKRSAVMKIDDSRRKVPDPYIDTIHESLNALLDN